MMTIETNTSSLIDGLLEEIFTYSFKTDTTGVKMAWTQNARFPHGGPLLRRASLDLSKVRGLPVLNTMVNILPAGIVVPMHKDFIAPSPMQAVTPRVERWHLPLQTNVHCAYWDAESGHTHMTTGKWWGPIPYWKNHSIKNLGREDRVHVVVDLDCATPRGEYLDGNL